MAATTPPDVPDELLPATRRALAHRVAVGQAEGRTPSLVAAVVRDGRQAWCGARSMLAGHEPGGDTQYRIGSITKTFVAVLVMRLRDEGLLDLADPVARRRQGPRLPVPGRAGRQLDRPGRLLRGRDAVGGARPRRHAVPP